MSPSKSQTYKSLKLSEKIAAIREVEKGLKKKSKVANDFRIPPTTLSTYLKNKEKILNSVHESGKNRKRYKALNNQNSDVETKVEEAENYENNDNSLKYKPINKCVIDSYRLASDVVASDDQVCVIQYDGNADEYMIGSTPISWDSKRGEIYLGKGSKRNIFPYTSGVIHFLSEIEVNENLYTVNDLALYKQILEFTVAYLHAASILKDAPAHKYRNVVQPLFQRNVQSVTIHHNKTAKKDTHSTDSGVWFEDDLYIYLDDPNEMVDRLLVLHKSKQSGNTGVDIEIRMIEEKLDEEGYIQLN